MTAPAKNDLTTLIKLLGVFSAATSQLATLKGKTDGIFLKFIERQKDGYGEIQHELTESEAAIKELAARHPEWFAKEKTLKFPFGDVQSRTTTSHETFDEAATIARIRAAMERVYRADDMEEYARLNALIRVTESLNLEAVGELDVETLGRFGIVRKVEESITVKAAGVNMGRAIKAAEDRAAKAQKKPNE